MALMGRHYVMGKPRSLIVVSLQPGDGKPRRSGRCSPTFRVAENCHRAFESLLLASLGTARAHRHSRQVILWVAAGRVGAQAGAALPGKPLKLLLFDKITAPRGGISPIRINFPPSLTDAGAAQCVELGPNRNNPHA